MNRIGRFLCCVALVAGMVLLPARLHAEDKVVRLVWFRDSRRTENGWPRRTAVGKPGKGAKLRVWDAKTGKPKFVVTADRGIRSVGWDPKGKTVAAGGYAGVLRFYDAETGDPTGQIKNLSENPR